MKNYNKAMKAIEESMSKAKSTASRNGLLSKKDNQSSSEDNVASVLASYIMNIRKSTKEILNGKA